MEQNTGNKVATRVIITKTLAGKSEERQYTIGRYVNEVFTALSSTEIAKLKDAEYQNCIYDTKRYIAQAEGIEDIDGIFTNEPLVRDTAMCPIEVPDEKVHTITMTSFASNITLLASSGGDEEITVDWGDGNTETMPLGGIAHDYSDGKVEHNIIIKGKVTSLTCHRAQLSFLDISKNTALTYLNCYDNQLTELDVSKNTALTELNCEFNQLTELDVSKNTALTYLKCSLNKLTQLDVSKNTALTRLISSDNQLTHLDVTLNTALTYLSCGNDQTTQLDVSKNTALTWLFCSKTQITELDVSKNTALTELGCNENQLTELDVSKNTALTELNCSLNKLTQLDVSKNTALTYLSCYDNQLTELDVSKNTALTELNCNDNQISSLDFSHNPELYYMDCDNNPVERNQDSVLSLVGSLRDRTGMTQGYIGINGDNYPGDIKALAATCRQKNWQLRF